MIEPKYAAGDRVVITVANDTFTGRHATVRSWKRRNTPRRIVYTLDIDGEAMRWGAGPYTEQELTKEQTVKITQITVSYGETQSLPEYSNVKPNLTLTATIADGEDAAAAEAELWTQAKNAVREQIDLALESNDIAAKYSTEPRYRVMRTYQGYTAHGRIDQPKIVVVFPNNVQLSERLDQRLGNPNYRDTKGLRYAHAMRIAAEYSSEQGYLLLDCTDGDLSGLLALLPEEPAAKQDEDMGGPGGADRYAAAFEPDEEYHESDDEDE